MTKQSALVLEGREIKVRLMAERAARGSFVHVDWLRVTFQLRKCPAPSVDVLFPKNIQDPTDLYFGSGQRTDLEKVVHPHLNELTQDELFAADRAYELGKQIAQTLGQDFAIESQLLPGRDFYKYRYTLSRKGYPIGWVGFLSASNGKYRTSQDKTVHLNLEGMGCTFAQHGWREKMADFIDEYGGLITRADLALDFFDGLKGGFDRVKADFLSGKMDCQGRRPAGRANEDLNEKSKGSSFYIGTRESGKLTNAYDKGKQLFGCEDDSNWFRIELRYGNQKRVIPSDILRRPHDFFAGASDWHASILAEHGAQYQAQPIKCTERLQQQSIDAEVSRSVRWFMETAAPSALLALKHLPIKVLDELFEEGKKLPNRLRKFDHDEIAATFAKCFHSVTGKGQAGMLTA